MGRRLIMSQYVIVEKVNGKDIPLRNKFGFVDVHKCSIKAHEERCYLQPDYDNLLLVKKG